MNLLASPLLVALWSVGPTFDGDTSGTPGVSVADYRSFAIVVGPNSQDASLTGSFTYSLQVRVPGGLPDPGAASTLPVVTSTGDIWVTILAGTHDLADGALVIRDVNSPYRDVRLLANFGAPPSAQVNAWLFLKKD